MPRDAPHNPKPILTFTHWLLLLVVINLVARLPLCWDPATVDNDGAEYLAITRHLRTTGQYATDLKWQFFTDDPVRHLAWADRPPLYPYLALLNQRALPFLDPTAAARVGNGVLACLGLILCAIYLRRLFGDRIALIAAGFAFLLPHTLKWTTQPMTETVTLVLTFGALQAWDISAEPLAQAASTRHLARKLSPQNGGIGTALLCGLLCGLAYLARPTGAVLLLVFLADSVRRAYVGARPPSPQSLTPDPQPPGPGHLYALGLLLGFALCAVPYHFRLWQLYGNPFHSALGFTFAVQTYYEVSYYGFEATKPTLLTFLRGHWSSIPGLILHQAWRHFQILVPQLLPFLPFALLMRRVDWGGRRWPGVALILGALLVHTLTWSAWGSSRYFLPCLPIAIALLLSTAERTREGRTTPSWLNQYTRFAPAMAGLGLAVCLGVFYATYARVDRGLPELPTWKAAASQVRGASLIASDKPAILNVLLATPCVRLPRTTDPAQLARFIGELHPEVLVLFADEPAEQPMAEAWRAGRLPEGWRLAVAEGNLLIAQPAMLAGRTVHERSGQLPQIRQAGARGLVN
jgi:hypothetical protein